MSSHTEFSKANDAYTTSVGDKKNLALPPAKKLAIGEYLMSRVVNVLTLSFNQSHVWMLALSAIPK